MRTSDRGIAALAVHEGIVPFPYLDSEGIWTVGIGHTAGAGFPDPSILPRGQRIDMIELLGWFRRDLRMFEDRVRRAVKVPLAQHEFDALVSFDFNTGGVHQAALTRFLNQGDRVSAAEAFLNWMRPASLAGRRREEKRLFETGQYPAGLVPVWRADDRGKLAGVKGRVTGELIARKVRLLTSHAGTAI